MNWELVGVVNVFWRVARVVLGMKGIVWEVLVAVVWPTAGVVWEVAWMFWGVVWLLERVVLGDTLEVKVFLCDG